MAAEISRAVAAGRPIRREILNYRKDGQPFWNDLSLDPVRDHAGGLVGFVGHQSEAVISHVAQNAQREAEHRLHSITSHVPGYVYHRLLRPSGEIEITYVSASINRFLGLPEGATVSGPDFYSRIHPDDQLMVRAGVLASAAGMSLFREEFRLIADDGPVRWFRSEASPRRMANGDIAWDGMAIEITAEKASAHRLAFLAYHDSLTGLSNRDRFKSAVSKAVATVALEVERVAIFVIDLDAFQEVNDSLGQAAGDEVLRTVAQRLAVHAPDAGGLVARFAGDEFAMLAPAITAEVSLLDMAEVIRRDLSRAMRIAGQEITLQVCVGATTFPPPAVFATPDRDTCAELLQRADLALRAAKQDGPGVCRLYSTDLDDRMRNRMVLRQSLHRAIDEQQFQLHYQPLVDIASGTVVGAEALVRWDHPDLGMQRPDLFIPLAEASGLILPLGAWVIREAMRQAQEWRSQGIAVPRIAINVSGIQLQRPGFIDMVGESLRATAADARDFEFELTEGVLIEASAEVSGVLRTLKTMGFGVTIDDFGTGHATFKYLRDFPVDKMKIDQTFVRKLVIDSNDATIIRAMIALANNLGIQIVAEGIEASLQRDFLLREGCTLGQGYLFSLPLSAEDFGWMLQNKVTLPISPAS